MYFHQLLLLIIHKFHGERSSTAPFYLLKGKKSGQTIQDVTYFNLHPFFSLYPKLSKEEYNVEVTKLLSNEFIEMNESSISLTEKGFLQMNSNRKPLYNGWLYRGNEVVFWNRIELVVQTLSNFQADEKRFVPNQKNQLVHQFVRSYLVMKNFQDSAFVIEFKKQIEQLLVSPIFEDIHRELFVYRLSGYDKSGMTWEQLARYYNLSILDVKLLFIEGLHIALAAITKERYPDLYAITKDIEVMTPLTDSAMKTYRLWEKGYNIHEIAEMRFLKINTIEDHIIEIVSIKQDFPIVDFMNEEQVRKVVQTSKELQTKKLKKIREQFPELSFFQIRLALTKGEVVNG
ncbi:recombinase RecQ [Psychrobacillus glaciei]|uniref:Recombinase RecQ n=1 Tax=Psychrobacillus glaciei TaxID=2283160 RepID=A0A5J6SLE7_9BACI|nr:helix-turn-helix domain-containing protein [Psychrobacillus glaciei]QFF98678.1 recombinase RecQ [Psychrobacillus glaciei]